MHVNRGTTERRSPSWAGKSEPARDREQERSLHCRRPAHSRQALTIKIERVNRRRGILPRLLRQEKKSTIGLQAGLGMRPAKWWKAIKPPHRSPLQPPQGPAYSCLCCKNPEKSGTGLCRERAGVKAAWRISAASEHHAQDWSSPGCRGGKVWGGWAAHRAGVRKARRGASLAWKELPARISVFHISYCQRPISPARGPCQCDRRAAARWQPLLRGRTAPCLHRSLERWAI